jgi:SAM-dependent methyltransferase
VVDEMTRLRGKGWNLPDRGADGVFWFHDRPQVPISFPEAGLEMLGEGTGFWFEHRGRAVASYLRHLGVSRLWEVGAGNGAMARQLRPAVEEVVAVEPWPAGARATAALGFTSLCASLSDLRLPARQLQAVGMFDVLEHVVDAQSLLAEIARVLIPGGVLILTVPALGWLWGDFDDATGHQRRYTRRSLDNQLTRSGFTRLRSEYLFASLVLPAAVTRALPYRLGRKSAPEELIARTRSQLAAGPVVDRVSRMVLGAEEAVARRAPLPLGLTVLGAYRAPRGRVGASAGSRPGWRRPAAHRQ